MGIEDLRIETAGMAIVRGKMVWIKSGGVDGLFRLLGTGSDRDIGSWDNFPDRLLEFLNALLDFAHEEEGVELKEDFHIDTRTRAAGTDFMKSIVVIQVLDKLAKDTELGGLLDCGIEEIVHGGGGHRPSGVEHEEDPDERGEGVEIPAPGLITKEVGQQEGGSHQGIEAGF
jgi:hypothetical protein